MLSLTLDTSSSQGSMVLGRDRRIVAVSEWDKEKSHSEKITNALQTLLDGQSASLADIRLLICGHGPGSFTGLRVGLSVVKSLAYSLNAPVIAIDDCMALALNHKTDLPILTMIDAQKNKVFFGIYQWHGDTLETLKSPQLADFEQVLNEASQTSYLCIGDGYKNYSSFFSSELFEKLRRETEISDLPHAEKIFSYVIEHQSDFTPLTWDQISALYLRASAAEEVRAQKLSTKK